MIRFRQLSLFWKLAVPVLLISLLWVAVIIIAATGMKESQARAHNLYTKNVSFVLQLQTLWHHFSDLDNLLLVHVASGDGQQIQALSKKIHAKKEAVETEFILLEKLVLVNHQHTLAEFTNIHNNYHHYMDKSTTVMRLSEDFEKLAAFEKMQELNSDIKHQIDGAITNIIDQEFNFMQRSYDQSQDIWQKNIFTLFATGCAVFILTLSLKYLIISRISRRISLVTACADKLSKGDLSARVEKDDYVDEISTLGLGLTLMAEDIKQSTGLLRESEDQVRMLLDSTAEAIYGIDLLGNCTFSNRACLQMLGYEYASELLGQNIHNLIHHSYADGAPYPVEECQIHKSIRTGHETHSDDEVLWRKDGSQFQAEYRSHPIFKEGKVIGAVISFLDITERKLTEKALQKSLNLLNDAQEIGHVGSWEWDINKNTIHWADETYRIFGFEPQEVPATYDVFLDRIHPEDRELVQHAVNNALDKKSPYNINHRILLTNGSERIVNEKGKVHYDAAGNPLLMIGTVQDITEVKKIEQDLRTYQEKLEVLVAERTAELLAAKEEADKANQAKSLFLSSMSHELRTPLNSILGFGQLLATDEKNPVTIAQQAHLQRILKSGAHLLSLIDDVLNLSKIESETVEISIEPVDVNAVLVETIELLQEIAKANKVKVSSNSIDMHNYIYADNTRFRQVIMNLLSNAIKYNQPEGSVDLSCEEKENYLRITVSDTGYGIAAEQENFLFEPFCRLGAETSTIEGTGIGLTITKRLVELMDGRIGFESERGKGSKFWVDFPLAESPIEASVSFSSPPKKAPRVPEGDYTILYVEDNKNNRELLLAILARTPNLKLLTAENGEQGVDMAVQYEPDLIFMDIGLPDMDGFAALNALQQHKKTEHIPTVALSGDAMPMDIKKALQAGFVQYITKPFNIADLYQVIGEVINNLPHQDKAKKTRRL